MAFTVFFFYHHHFYLVSYFQAGYVTKFIQGNQSITFETDVVLNIGFKSDGLVSLNEFRDIPGLKIGDEVEVMVVEKEDREGHLNLSRQIGRASCRERVEIR